MTTSTLPLLCSICAQKPTFSDVSHLLTHVASKGHLSHYYKTKVRASTDQVSRDAIEIYDTWYMEWNVEQLMSERLDVKDKRKQIKLNNRAAHCRSLKRNRPPPNTLDPRLSVLEPTINTVSPTKGDINNIPSFTQGHVVGTLRPARPQRHLWQTSLPASYRAVPLPSASPVDKSNNLFHPSEMSPASATVLDSDPPNQCGSIGESATKLKGVFWPGMAIFDAATPEMKRRRNQKKDISVLEHLEHNSSQVEAIEFVYRPSGSLKKSRPITGQVDPDSSPIKIERPLPKRRASSRTVLGNLDVNSHFLAGKPAPMKRGTVPRASKDKISLGQCFELDQNTQEQKSFSVNSSYENQPFGNPTGMRYLTSSFQYPPQSRTNPNNWTMTAAPALLYDPAYFVPATNSCADFFALPFLGVYESVGQDHPAILTTSPTVRIIEQFGQNELTDDNRTVSAHSDD